MNWLECVELKSAIAGEDVRFRFEDTSIHLDVERGEIDQLVIYSFLDFNCDKLKTISDVWEGIKWLVHIPGDLLFSWVATPGTMQFLELGATPYGTHFSTGLGWFIVFLLWIHVIIEAIKEGFR